MKKKILVIVVNVVILDKNRFEIKLGILFLNNVNKVLWYYMM